MHKCIKFNQVNYNENSEHITKQLRKSQQWSTPAIKYLISKQKIKCTKLEKAMTEKLWNLNYVKDNSSHSRLHKYVQNTSISKLPINKGSPRHTG